MCGCCPTDLPASLLEIHVALESPVHAAPTIPTTTVGVGYELRAWRAEALARHITDWVPDFALRDSERNSLTTGRVMERVRRALVATFGNGNDRGVAGEVLLHALLREHYGSSTLVHKIYFKTADNDTYKGFDAVHTVHATDGNLELWLGEAKFYRDITAALRAVADDLESHLAPGYLRNEFAIVAGKIEDSHPHAEEMRELLHPNRRLDEVYDRIVVPVFVTYDSEATSEHDHLCEEYVAALTAEAQGAQTDLARRLAVLQEAQRDAGDSRGDLPLEVRLFLLPMAGKTELLEALERLTAWAR